MEKKIKEIWDETCKKIDDLSTSASIFDETKWINVVEDEKKILPWVVTCAIRAERHPDITRKNLENVSFDWVFFDWGERSRYKPQQMCDIAMVYIEMSYEDGSTPEVALLYAECNPEEVPCEGHYDGEEWVFDDEHASEKYLFRALKKAAEEVAKETGSKEACFFYEAYDQE